jgi:hypothetical protein
VKKNTPEVSDAVTVHEIHMSHMRFNIVGTSPLVPHAVSAKAAGSLLFPSPKKNAAEKATSMKHEPMEEYVDACYRFIDSDNKPTRLYMPAGAFHGAMASVAIDMVGARKSQIGRLTTVPGGKIPIYGSPKLWMTIVRSSDMARTPDVRTLPILPEWCCTIDVQFVGSLIKEQSIANLLGAAGVIIGIGDGRPERGKLSMGQFRLCSDDDKDFQRIVKQGGTKAQDAALKDPAFFDIETEKLMSWFVAERKKRSAAPAPQPKRKKSDDAVAVTKVKQNGKGERRQNLT